MFLDNSTGTADDDFQVIPPVAVTPPEHQEPVIHEAPDILAEPTVVILLDILPDQGSCQLG